LVFVGAVFGASSCVGSHPCCDDMDGGGVLDVGRPDVPATADVPFASDVPSHTDVPDRMDASDPAMDAPASVDVGLFDVGLTDAGLDAPDAPSRTSMVAGGDGTLLRLHAVETGIVVAEPSLVRLFAPDGVELARWTPPSNIVVFTAEGSTLVAVMGDVVQLLGPTLTPVRSFRAAEPCVNALVLEERHLVCQLGGGRSVLVTYDIETGLEEARTTGADGPIGVGDFFPMGPNAFVAMRFWNVAVGGVYQLDDTGAVLVRARGLDHGFFRPADPYGFVGAPVESLVASDGSLFALAGCLDGSGCLTPAGRADVLASGDEFAFMERAGSDRLYAVVTRNTGKVTRCRAGASCRLQRIDVATDSIERDVPLAVTGVQMLELTHDSRTGDAYLAACRGGELCPGWDLYRIVMD